MGMKQLRYVICGREGFMNLFAVWMRLLL